MCRRVCDGASECMRVAQDELRHGADFIKIMGAGGVVSPIDWLLNKKFSLDEIRAMALVAENAEHLHHLLHLCTYALESIYAAIENGVKCIEHGKLLDSTTRK